MSPLSAAKERLVRQPSRPSLVEKGNSSSRCLGLDGLRAVSIALVLCVHFVDSGSVSYSTWFGAFARHGDFGVQIFFVLSGFLITQLLLGEESVSGRISLKAFYIKRAFRIQPPVLALLAGTFLMSLAGFFIVDKREFLTCLLMVHNYFPGHLELGHFWSLSIEEQFYAFFPLFLLCVRDRRSRVAGLAALFVGSVLWQRFNWSVYEHNPWRTEFQVQGLLMGCLLALLRQSPYVRSLLQKPILQGGVCFLCSWGALVYTFTPFWAGNVWMRPVRAVLVALIINSLAWPTGRWFDRAFGSRPMVFLGQISYSLYLWQQMFCRGAPLHWFQQIPVNVLLAVGFSYLSYRFLEQPALRFRNRLLLRLKTE